MSNESGYWSHRALGRRSFLGGAALGGLGLSAAALIGCSSGDGSSSTPAPAGASPGAANQGEQPVVSDAFIAVQTRDAPSLEPLDSVVYTIPERIGLVYPRLVYSTLEKPSDPSSVKWIPSYVVEGWEVTDGGKQMTFKLRKGVKHQNIAPLNGREFVASDVKFSLNRYMTNAKSPFVGRFEDISSIETPDNYTVVLKLKAPSRYLITALAAESALISPPEIEADYKQKAIGPGPFIHEQYLQGEGSTLRKNPDFVDASKIYYNRYLFKVIADAATRQAAQKTGQADFGIGGLGPTALKSVEGPAVTTYPVLSASTQQISWNMKNPKWADIRARQAMSKAFDRQAIIDQVFQGAAKWTGIVPVDFGKWALSEADVKQVNFYKYDPADAKKLWDAAGKPGMANEMYFSSQTTEPGILGQLVARQWEQNLGIKTDLKTEDYSILVPRFYSGGYPDMAFFGYTIPNWMEHLFAPYLPGGARNSSNINDANLIAMLADFRTTLDDNAAVEKSHKIQRHIQDNLFPMAQLPQPTLTGVYNAKLRNFVPGGYPPGLEWMLGSWKAK